MCWYETFAPYIPGLIAGLIALLIAIFHEGLKRLLFKPSLLLEKSNDYGRQEIPTSLDNCVCDALWYRLCVRNKGNVCAEDVEVSIQDLRREGKSQAIEGFLPINLKWAHHDLEYVMAQLPRRTSKLITLGYIFYFKDRLPHGPAFRLDVIPKPNNRFYLLPAGTYSLNIVIAAKNSRPFPFTVKLTLKDLDTNWHSTDNIDKDFDMTKIKYPKVDVEIKRMTWRVATLIKIRARIFRPALCILDCVI